MPAASSLQLEAVQAGLLILIEQAVLNLKCINAAGVQWHLPPQYDCCLLFYCTYPYSFPSNLVTTA